MNKHLNIHDEEVELGDWVVYTYGHRSYYDINVGIVVGFTDDYVKVKNKFGTTNRHSNVLYNYHDFSRSSLLHLEIMQEEIDNEN